MKLISSEKKRILEAFFNNIVRIRRAGKIIKHFANFFSVVDRALSIAK